MKQRIRIKQKGKPDIVKEFEIPNKAHLDAQITYKHQVHKLKTKTLKRKSKHKKKDFELDE